MIATKYIHTLSDTALNSLITQYSKRANSRIDRLLKSGYWQRSAYIQRKWSPLTHTTPIGTTSGRFSRSISGSRATREEQLKQIINFLNAKTTLKEIKSSVKSYFNKMGFDVDTQEDFDKAGAIVTLYEEYYNVLRSQGLDSDTILKIITEQVNHSNSIDDVRQTIENAIAKAKTRDDLMQQLTNDYEYF